MDCLMLIVLTAKVSDNRRYINRYYERANKRSSGASSRAAPERVNGVETPLFISLTSDRV
jgi:hypothetical protein